MGLEGVTSYEILGYGACATVRKIIKMTMVHESTGSGMSSDDIGEFHVMFVDEDGIANGYVGTYTEEFEKFELERYTKATSTLPSVSVSSSYLDLVSEGFTKVLDEFFIEGDSQVTATLTNSGGYRLDIDGTSRDDEFVTFKIVQEGDNDLLAVVAGG